MAHLMQGDGVGAFLASVQAANPSEVETASSDDAAPIRQPDFGADDSKDDAMEE